MVQVAGESGLNGGECTKFWKAARAWSGVTQGSWPWEGAIGGPRFGWTDFSTAPRESVSAQRGTGRVAGPDNGDAGVGRDTRAGERSECMCCVFV
jgi:hypothetical protein